MRNFFLHLHPVRISEASLRFNRTFGLGGMAALLIAVQLITGLMLRFYYVPAVAGAYDSILTLKHEVLFGQLTRNLHHWSGVFLLLITFLHLLRTFFTGAFRGSRKINWIIGLVLLLLIIASNFTGYLLPWDQLAYWAVTVVTNLTTYLPWFGKNLQALIIGGSELNENTLRIFYTFHTALLPFLLVMLMLYHFWRVRKAGGVMVPASEDKSVMAPSFPDLVFREFIVALVLMALLFSFSALFNAPLQERANPAYSINPTKAPWYFAGIQELLMHFHPFFAAFVIPLGVMIFLAWIPYIRYTEVSNGQWFISASGKVSARSAVVFAAAVTIAGIIVNACILNFETAFPYLPAVISNGLIPCLIIGLLTFCYYRFYLKRMQLSRPEIVQVIFVLIVTAFLILTVTGIFFRGKDMSLCWPWNVW